MYRRVGICSKRGTLQPFDSDLGSVVSTQTSNHIEDETKGESGLGRQKRLIESAVPNAESANYIASLSSGLTSYPDLSRVISANSQQYLALSEGVKQALESAYDFAPILESIKGLTAEYSARSLAIAEAIKPTLEATQAIASAAQCAIDGVKSYAPAILDVMSSARKTYAEYLDISAQLSKSFASMFQSIRESGAFFDIDELRSRHETWGEYGWVLFDGMTGSVSRAKPQTWVEANKIARACISKGTVDDLFERLSSSVSKRRDLDEAITLFEERRYKPCAMMVCALIDCSLYKRSKKRGNENRRNAKEPFERLQLQLPGACYTALSLSGSYKAYDYFFKPAKDFDRKVEGEFNRNSLMHGMSHRDITRTSCLKLFMLLLSIERLMTVI